MYRVLMNCKKVVAAIMLCMIVVCGLSSVSQAGVSVDAGRQYKNGEYRSITKVSAYESNGAPKKVKATASMNGEKERTASDDGSVTARSGWVSSIADANHGYAVGGEKLIEFVNNKPM